MYVIFVHLYLAAFSARWNHGLWQCTSYTHTWYFPSYIINISGDSTCIHYFKLGHGLRVQHFRQNEECGVTEELVMIDENLRYDFDYQVKYINTI